MVKKEVDHWLYKVYPIIRIRGRNSPFFSGYFCVLQYDAHYSIKTGDNSGFKCCMYKIFGGDLQKSRTVLFDLNRKEIELNENNA